QEAGTTSLITFVYRDMRFAVDLLLVREVVEDWWLSPYPEEVCGHIGVVNVRGSIVPVIHPDMPGVQARDDKAVKSQRLLLFDIDEKSSVAIIVSDVRKVTARIKTPRDGEILNLGSRPVTYVEIHGVLEQMRAAV